MALTFILVTGGDLSINAGHPWRGLWCLILGITVFIKAPRTNTEVRDGGLPPFSGPTGSGPV